MSNCLQVFFPIATDKPNTSIHPSVCQLKNALRKKPTTFPFCPREEEEEEEEEEDQV
jgi:hypothetical protein